MPEEQSDTAKPMAADADSSGAITAGYIEELTAELVTLAKRENLIMLSQMLALARDEASRIVAPNRSMIKRSVQG